MLHIMLIESQLIVRKAIKKVLESNTEIEVIADICNETFAIQKIEGGSRPDIIICEIFGEDSSRLGFKKIKTRWPEIKVVVLSAFNSEIFVIQAFLGGSSAYLTKDIDKEELFYGLHSVQQGKRYLSKSVTIKLTDKRLKNII